MLMRGNQMYAMTPATCKFYKESDSTILVITLILSLSLLQSLSEKTTLTLLVAIYDKQDVIFSYFICDNGILDMKKCGRDLWCFKDAIWVI